jgi:DNA mismatch repair protein MutS2
VKTRVIRKEAEKAKEKMREDIDQFEKHEGPKPAVPLKYTRPLQPKTEKKPEDKEIHVGDSVFIVDIQTVGEVSSINGQDVVVDFNSVSFRTSLKKLTKISKKEAKDVKKHGMKIVGTGSLSELMNQKIASFNPTLDLRGARADEAVSMLEPYIDEAVLLSVHQVRILHGKGNGILRKIVREQLSRRRDVISFTDEALELGGYGVTIVEL